eukprot:SAG31_NODE_33647_length_341_cov_1.000000_1_plen_102_part_10
MARCALIALGSIAVASRATGAAGSWAVPEKEPPDPIAYSGRFVRNPNGSRTFDWAAASFVFRVQGAANLSMAMADAKTNRYAVYSYTLPESSPDSSAALPTY